MFSLLLANLPLALLCCSVCSDLRNVVGKQISKTALNDAHWKISRARSYVLMGLAVENHLTASFKTKCLYFFVVL